MGIWANSVVSLIQAFLLDCHAREAASAGAHRKAMETVKVCITGSVTSNWSHTDCCSERCEGHGETWQACSTWHACKCFSKCFDSPLSELEGACCWYNSRCDSQMYFLGSAVKERLCMRFFFSQEICQKKDPQSAWNWWREFTQLQSFLPLLVVGEYLGTHFKECFSF